MSETKTAVAPTVDEPGTKDPALDVIQIGFTIENQTQYNLTINQSRCSGVDFSAWPQSIPAGGTARFSQGGTFQVKFDAWYYVNNFPGTGAQVDFSGYWTAGWYHDSAITSDPAGVFPGSSTVPTSNSCTYILK